MGESKENNPTYREIQTITGFDLTGAHITSLI